MTPEQENHLRRIKVAFDTTVEAKYRAGAREHGGNVWDIDVLDLVDHAIDEAVDQIVYLLTLRDELRIRLGSYPNVR